MPLTVSQSVINTTKLHSC